MGSSGKVKVPFAIVPLFLGFGVLLTGAILLLIDLRPDMDSTTTGSITAVDQGISSSHVTRCSLKAEFAVHGQTYVASSLDSSASNCELQIGDAIAVEYNSANPAMNQIRAGYLLWLGAGLTAGGFLLLLLGGGLLVRSMRKGRR